MSVVDPAAGFPPDTLPLAEHYLEMLDRFGGFVAQVMAAIANAPDGGVMVHCAAGKDRTGLISALLLGLVDVPAETIAADYAMTAELLRPREEAWLENGPGERAGREAMLAVLAGLTERYGGVEAYLLEAGLARDDLDRLRERLLAPRRPGATLAGRRRPDFGAHAAPGRVAAGAPRAWEALSAGEAGTGPSRMVSRGRYGRCQG